MTFGNKITFLRNKYNISQQKLADYLHISRQSVSKWEIDEVFPTIDKVKELAKIFHVTINDLVDDSNDLSKQNNISYIKKNGKTKYFGTDGFRGESNITLTSDHAYKIGRFLGWYLSKNKTNHEERPKVVLGKDTRRSSYMYEYAISAGLSSSGCDVFLLHVTTTPSISYIVLSDHFDAGIMITASHNPFYDNGIKIINSNGLKLNDDVALQIEAYLDGNLKTLGIEEKDIPFAKKDQIGVITDYMYGRNRYVGYLISLATHSFKTLRIGLDTANGASFTIAKNVFDALGAKTYIINNEPNGLNVNLNAGSTHIDNLVNFVKDNKLDVGFAFDGDADRCIAIDELGHVVDGDKILYLLANKLKRDNLLNGNTVVATVMSNTGLNKALKNKGIDLIQTDVGDRFVYEEMKNNNYSLGGEQSGHIIMRKYATTGDGILTAIMVVEEMLNSKQSLHELTKAVKIYPQKLKNVKVPDKNLVMNDEEVKKKIDELNQSIKDNGRVFIRASGTEPLIRIMVEAESLEICDQYIESMYKTLKKRGYVCE